MSDMNEYMPDLIELIDENGKKRRFELIDAAEIDDEQYYALVPSAEDDDYLAGDCEVVILKTVEDNGEEFLEYIEDEDELDMVSAFFEERMNEYFEE